MTHKVWRICLKAILCFTRFENGIVQVICGFFVNCCTLLGFFSQGIPRRLHLYFVASIVIFCNFLRRNCQFLTIVTFIDVSLTTTAVHKCVYFCLGKHQSPCHIAFYVFRRGVCEAKFFCSAYVLILIVLVIWTLTGVALYWLYLLQWVRCHRS